MNKTPFDSIEPATGPRGQLAHPDHIAQDALLEPRLYTVTDGVWCIVGNGLSNQSFIEGPHGVICVDTGESVEEMAVALAALRRRTQAPIVACIYTHFHYVEGTRAILDEGATDLAVYGHPGIAGNRARYGGETAPRITRGMVRQFAIGAPEQGEDACVNVGLGRFFRNPEHRPFTAGHMPVTHPVADGEETGIAGLRVVFRHAPSDADDSITICFPELGVCVQNLVWPALFNVFAIRGEAYRDPRTVIEGIDQLRAIAPRHMLATHGPPLSGVEEISTAVTDARDAIQFMWDQTVRGANLGLGLDDLGDFVRLPDRFSRTVHTRELYGVVEHHAKQIYTGLFGWFDEDPARVLPLPADERAKRMVDGFGGAAVVRERHTEAMAQEDWRWAVELASWLVRTTDDVQDRERLAKALRAVGQRTPSANLRNWCVTGALELDGAIDLGRFRRHRFRTDEILSRPIQQSVHVLRVLVVPERTEGMDVSLRFRFDDGTMTGLDIRPGVAVPTDGEQADHELAIPRQCWAQLLAGEATLDETLADDRVTISGDEAAVRALLAAFDHPALAAS